MDLQIFQVDAFTNEVFKGNPAAVVPLEQWLDDALMMQIAAENNLSETAFIVPLEENEEADYFIRWFTPTQEVELCGHATLATSYILWNRLGFSKDQITFKTKLAGDLYVQQVEELIQLDFPQRKAQPFDLPEGFEEALGVKPIEFQLALKNFAILENADQVRNFKPDMDYISQLPQGDGLIITARADDAEQDHIDCVSRYFCPAAGIPEDPVTGSAHCTIIPYWAEKLGKNTIHARQASERSGELLCTLSGDRILLKGTGKIFMEGVIHI